MPKRKGPPLDREALWERSEGICDWCNRAIHYEAFDAHHRKLRSAGGTWALSNIVAVHSDCHTNQPGSIHMHPALAKSRGFIVPSWGDPVTTPITVLGALWWLRDDGTMDKIELGF